MAWRQYLCGGRLNGYLNVVDTVEVTIEVGTNQLAYLLTSHPCYLNGCGGGASVSIACAMLTAGGGVDSIRTPQHRSGAQMQD